MPRTAHDLVLTARGERRLAATAEEIAARHGVAVRTIAKDLSLPGAAEALYQDLGTAQHSPDVLVNNAGFGLYGTFASLDLAAQRDIIQVNVTALTELTRLISPDMRARGTGRILNVASTAAFVPGPLMAVYYATKAYVLHFSEALGEELRGSGVSVTALCPGLTATGFQATAGLEGVRLFKLGMMDAAEVAHYGYRAMMQGRAIAVPGIKNRIGAHASRFLPRALMRVIVHQIQKKPA